MSEQLIRTPGNVFVSVATPTTVKQVARAKDYGKDWATVAVEMAKDTPEPTPAPPPEPARLDGLGWYKHRTDGAMLFDDREQSPGRFKPRNRDNVLAYINRTREGVYWINLIAKDVLRISNPIPRHVNRIGEAILWVLTHASRRQ